MNPTDSPIPRSTATVAQARTDAAALLEALGLAAFVFEIEPRDPQWELRVECALIQGWQRVSFPVDATLLARSRTETSVRERLLADWQNHLRACRYA